MIIISSGRDHCDVVLIAWSCYYLFYNNIINNVTRVLVAGVNPTSLRGSNTAVVVGTTNNDCADWWSVDPAKTNGYEFLGNTRTMFPNRVSFSFDLRGMYNHAVAVRNTAVTVTEYTIISPGLWIKCNYCATKTDEKVHWNMLLYYLKHTREIIFLLRPPASP